MTRLVVGVVLSILFAIFATQNTQSVTIWLFDYTVPYVPVYMVVLSSILAGLLLSWIISLIQSVSSGFTLRGKESRIKSYEKEVGDLTRRVHNLELENTRLKTKTGESGDEDSL